MIPKSGNRFSEKIMHEQNVRSDFDSIGMDRTLAAGVRLADAVLHGEALLASRWRAIWFTFAVLHSEVGRAADGRTVSVQPFASSLILTAPPLALITVAAPLKILSWLVRRRAVAGLNDGSTDDRAVGGRARRPAALLRQGLRRENRRAN